MPLGSDADCVEVDKSAFLCVLVLGSGALACWVDVRYPRLGSPDWRRVSIHVVVSIMLLRFVLPSGIELALAPGVLAVAVAGVVSAGVAAFGYAFLSGIWVLRVARQALSGSLR